MYSSCLEKQQRMAALFGACSCSDTKFQKIIDLGRKLPRLDLEHKVPGNIVPGCQSTMYLHSQVNGDKIQFTVDSEALISAGLAAILIEVYSGESIETVLKCPPDFLDTLGIRASLTPSRANGLYSIHLRMKQEALKHYILNNRINST